jgi:hypothetical protein
MFYLGSGTRASFGDQAIQLKAGHAGAFTSPIGRGIVHIGGFTLQRWSAGISLLGFNQIASFAKTSCSYQNFGATNAC